MVDSRVAGWIVAIIGLVPLAAGIFDWYVFALLFELPFLGVHLRHTIESKRHTLACGFGCTWSVKTNRE